MHAPVPLRRLFYRAAYTLLRVWWLVGRPRVEGVKFLLTDGDRVLLVRHTYGHSVWDIPGGSIKRREAPLAAARREAHEELGLAVEHWTALGEVSGRMNHRRDTLHCFQAELREPRLRIDRGELAAASWFARSELPAALSEYVLPILERVPASPDPSPPEARR
jgi:8-oxo-dGTP pyrophosphatase MutT (NUDIX family)